VSHVCVDAVQSAEQLWCQLPAMTEMRSKMSGMLVNPTYTLFRTGVAVPAAGLRVGLTAHNNQSAL
jgi:hypothetical protein